MGEGESQGEAGRAGRSGEGWGRNGLELAAGRAAPKPQPHKLTSALNVLADQVIHPPPRRVASTARCRHV
ncbi:hypothetical protein RR46_02154 [Papilio xuthus]|uniref:Uncharacterized protein n=1 Tax=Papilio xuthus TaxID=66420 RepID=A0A194QJ04_PAPXU|nr:hypothetical protein RR46_02154 [Papilio xuthus]